MWVKHVAKFWSDGAITDTQFIQGIQYLIDTNIIKIPSSGATNNVLSQIPSWVKSDAKSWSVDSISNNEFAAAIQYLISNGLMHVSYAQNASTNSSDIPKGQVKIGGVLLDVDIANTPQLQTKGLQYHTPLSYGQGMLFPFSQPQVIPIWMKEMQFPIDIIWFDGSGNVLHVEKNAPACTVDPCTIYGQDITQAQYVLEVASGFADRFGIDQSSHLQILTQP